MASKVVTLSKEINISLWQLVRNILIIIFILLITTNLYDDDDDDDNDVTFLT